MTGTVAAFDDHKGYGTVRASDGSEYFFHCTQISGASRTIEVGTAVIFDIAPGRLGRWEASAVTAVT